MSSRRTASPARALVAIFVSIASHALVIYGLMALGLGGLVSPSSLSLVSVQEGRPSSIKPEEDDRPIEIQTLVDTLAEKDERTPEEMKAEEEKKREAEDKNAKGQVVDIERPALEARPDESKYLAEYDSRVSHEMRAPAGRDNAGARQAIEGGAEAPHPAVKALPSGNPAARPGLPGQRSQRSQRQGTEGQEGEPHEVGPDGEMARPGLPGTPGRTPLPSLGEGGVPGMPGAPQPNLKPTEEMLRRAISKGSGSPDFLQDVDNGEATALNAKSFKYASFFNRVKRAVNDEWHPDVVYVRHDPTGNVYGGKDRVTVVRVHLRPDGSLQGLTMLQSSGVGFLDDEGLDALRHAQPYLHPPPELVDSDGLIHFNFGFVFELSGKTSLKVFKYK